MLFGEPDKEFHLKARAVKTFPNLAQDIVGVWREERDPNPDWVIEFTDTGKFIVFDSEWVEEYEVSPNSIFTRDEQNILGYWNVISLSQNRLEIGILRLPEYNTVLVQDR